MKQDIIDGSVNAFQYILTMAQTNEELKFISLLLSVISTAIIVLPKLYRAAVNLIHKVKAWHAKAMQDNKIDKQELKELHEIVSDSADEVVEIVEEIEKERND